MKAKNLLETSVAALLILTLISSTESYATELLNNTVELNRIWAESVFAEHPRFEVKSNKLVLLKEDGVGETRFNLAAVGTPIRLGQKTYTRGIGTNSYCAIRIILEKPAQRFQSDIGLDRNVDDTTPASVRFRVLSGEKELFATQVIRPKDGVQSINVPLQGAMEFDLIIDDAGDGRTCDQADWADARVTLADGSVLWLDDLAAEGSVVAALPFSFVYDGKPSSELLANWNCEVKNEQPAPTQKVRTLIFTDPKTDLEIKVVANIYLDTPGVDWTIYLTNNGTKDTPILEKLFAVDFTIQPPVNAMAAWKKITNLMSIDDQDWVRNSGNNPALYRLSGTTASLNDFIPQKDSLPIGAKFEWGTPIAGSSYESFPFFTLDWGGAGVITALGWTGQWMATVDRTTSAINISAGMRNLRLYLKPGETIRSPRVMQVYWNGGDKFDAYNLLRRTMLTHILPRVNGEIVFPPFAHSSSSFYEKDTTTEAIERSYIESFKNLGFEYYWLDAWWVKGGYPNGLGQWGFPITRGYDPIRFPNGIKPLRDLAKSYNIKFLQWFAPEEIRPGTDLATEHPEWVINTPGVPGLIDLTNPEALNYMINYLNAVIKEWGIDWWRSDGGPSVLHWKSHDTDPNRIGITEIRYVQGYYQMWDAMRNANPNLMLDNCSGGGSRIDLETASRSISLSITDSACWTLNKKDKLTAAIQNQTMSHGLNRYIPLSESLSMGAEPYYFRSGFNGGNSFCEDTRPTDYPRELLKQGIAEGKRLRKYLLGNFYPLSVSSISPRDWCVYQYHRPAESDGIVFAFRRHESPYAAYAVVLRDIDENADYVVTQAYDYAPLPPKTMKGSELKRLKVNIDLCPGSVVIEYRKAD
ncbi:MAG TPA: NPCBM/NEW2 domain-containing protein [Sedimentisphaerales bacterium]|nr:NPCBM/NEW2 domain-containing protein [Sedimentisphaerales bacterium]